MKSGRWNYGIFPWENDGLDFFAIYTGFPTLGLWEYMCGIVDTI